MIEPPPENVVELVPYREECVGVTKLRAIEPDGTAVWDAWCCTHHHWLNGKGAKSILDQMTKDLQRE